MNSSVSDYIAALNGNRGFDIDGLCAQSKQEKVPVVSREVGQLLALAVKMLRPRRILEIGSGYGLSTLFMAQADPQVELLTIDGNRDRVDFVRGLAKHYGLQERIETRHVMAADFFKANQATFNMIFLDSAKRDYPELYESCLEALEPGGLLAADNILFQGRTVPSHEPSDKHRIMTEKLREFNQTVSTDPRVTPFFFESGDGLLLAFKK